MAEITIALAEERLPHKTPDGKDAEYILTPPNYGTRRDFTTYLEKLLIERVTRQRAAYGSNAEYREARADALTVDCDWGGAHWQKKLENDECVRELCFYTLRQQHPNLTRQEFTQLFDSPEKRLTIENDPTGIPAGKEIDSVKGFRIWQTILRFINRPN